MHLVEARLAGGHSMQGGPLWIRDILAVHIVAGGLCLVLAPIALALTKGGRWHRRWGTLYFWSMGAVAATALPLAMVRSVLFLALVAVLSFYLTFSGYRVLRLKDLAQGGSAKPIDWAAAVLTFAACACLAGFALYRPAWVQNMGIVAIVLGLLGMRAAAADIYRFVRKPTQRLFWLTVHLEKFIASYIAAWTAFSVVTLSRLFPHATLAVWLWPATIGVPAIALTVVYYRRKYAGASTQSLPSPA
jgi:hypothetical protein